MFPMPQMKVMISLIGVSMLSLTLFTPKTITSNLIKSLENSSTVTLILFPPGAAQKGIMEVIQEYTTTFPNTHPELLTWVEGDVKDAESIQKKYLQLLIAGNIRFVNEHGKLISG